MQLIYQGTDITDSVDVVEAVYRDVSDGRADSLDLVLEHPGAWVQWKPRLDDVMELSQGTLRTGKLFLNTIAPEEDHFRILATAAKSRTRRRAWGSYQEKTLQEIFEQCAAESKMEMKLYGIDGKLFYPYLLRKNEGCAAFLSRISNMEGACLKTFSGRYTAIGVLAAQDIPASATIELAAGQPGVSYSRRENAKYASVTVRSPYASATAYDKGAAQGEDLIISDLPAMDNATAGRWARGLILMNNRRAEELTIESELNAGFTAMARIDVSGRPDAAGEWLIDEAEHDLVNGKSRARLFRCIRTVV